MYQFDMGNNTIHVHFIGIGGISMSGLASLLLSRGFQVSGSDSRRSGLCVQLEKEGAVIGYPQKAENIPPDTGLVVYTAAIHPDNPEYRKAMEEGIPMLDRAKFLGQIMKLYKMPAAIAGTHGKTTTTSMLSEILLRSGTDPTLSIGGILPSIDSNFRVGGGDYFVAEACEYTNSFLSLYAKMGVILNIDNDHLDFFKDLDDIRSSFRRFALGIPGDGTLIINGSDPSTPYVTEGLDCRVVTFGMEEGFDYHASDVLMDGHSFPSFDLYEGGSLLGRVTLGVHGIHNIMNALAASAAARILGCSFDTIAEALSAFGGTHRRFEFKGRKNGVTVIDDYAHHPSEIRATLKAAMSLPHRELYLVFQPHTYSRTKALFEDFAQALKEAQHVILPDIYAARETDDLKVSSRLLSERINELGGDSCYMPGFEDIKKFLSEKCIHDDLLITMGAGDVYKIGDSFLNS